MTADGWGNLFAAVPRAAADEEFRALLTRPGLRIERIVSTGQVSADWYDQPRDEWVLLVEGGAHLLIEGEGDLVLGPGDHLLIPAHTRHRVTWTDPDRPTIWLAVHFDAGVPAERRLTGPFRGITHPFGHKCLHSQGDR